MYEEARSSVWVGIGERDHNESRQKWTKKKGVPGL